MNKKRNSLVIAITIILICILIFATIIVLKNIRGIDNIGNEDINNNLNNDNPNLKPPEEEISLDLFGKFYNKAKEKMKEMSLEEKVGQLFFSRCPETGAAEEIKNLNPGGYILFARDFENKYKADVIDNITSYQKSSKIPMLIGVDEEGGTVVRASKYKAFRNTPFKSPQEIYSASGFEGIKSDTIEKSRLLKDLGINVNLAPVSDVSTSTNDFIHQRSFGKDATLTSQYVSLVVKTMNEQKIGSTLKHFPGYGSNIDTHTGIAYDNREYSTFTSSDFLPFMAGIKEEVPSILVSHNIVKCMDEKFPASLSEKVHKILKEDLNFTGIIMTDDLSMDAIKKYTNGENAAVFAVKAGNDLLVTSDFKIQRDAILTSINNKDISEERINESVIKILAWKYSMGIM